MKHLVSGDKEFVALWHRICDEQASKQREWVQRLRSIGISASHPDDGWVDRRENTVCLVYPHFNDGVSVGSMVALGEPDSFRIVEITASIKNTFSMMSPRWKFVSVTGMECK